MFSSSLGGNDLESSNEGREMVFEAMEMLYWACLVGGAGSIHFNLARQSGCFRGERGEAF